jgi:hypothetical protein
VGDDFPALLGPARERYYRLVLVLSESRWQERLRRELPLVREVRAHQAALDALLDAKAWPEGHPLSRDVLEVESLREQLIRDVARKLGHSPHASLPRLMEALEDWLITLPREVPAHLREDTARELLADGLPALHEATAFGTLLESLFCVPLRLAGRLPLSTPQREALAARWPRGEAALGALWRRLSGVDARGFMVAELRKRATLAPRGAPPSGPASGPARLLHAEYWYQEARSRLLALARLRLAPLELSSAEALTAMWWLFQREYASQVRFVSPDVAPARAALVEMAFELWDAQREDLPEDERWTPARWSRLERLAGQVEQARNPPGAEQVREALQGLLGRAGIGTRSQRGWWSSPGLEELVRAARGALG